MDAFDTPELHALIQDMEDTMQAQNGAGLAAPQIGVPLQVVIFGVGSINPRYPDAEQVPYTVLINPVLEPRRRRDGRGLGRLPVGAGHARSRAALRAAALQGYDQYGNPIDRTVAGFHARVVQHEVRPPGWHPLSDAHPRPAQFRLQRGAVSRARTDDDE